MAGERKVAPDFAGAGFAKPLCRSFMCFHLGHSNFSRKLVPFTGGFKIKFYCSRSTDNGTLFFNHVLGCEYHGQRTAFMLGGLLVPTWLGPVERGWMAFAQAISKVTTPIVMGVVYFVVVVPIGLSMRLFGHNPMVRESVDGSLWTTRSDSEGRGGMQRQF